MESIGQVQCLLHASTPFRQTNNAAELLAALCAVEFFPKGPIATFTDSQYVILGGVGAQRHWKLRG